MIKFMSAIEGRTWRVETTPVQRAPGPQRPRRAQRASTSNASSPTAGHSRQAVSAVALGVAQDAQAAPGVYSKTWFPNSQRLAARLEWRAGCALFAFPLPHTREGSGAPQGATNPACACEAQRTLAKRARLAALHLRLWQVPLAAFAQLRSALACPAILSSREPSPPNPKRI